MKAVKIILFVIVLIFALPLIIDKVTEYEYADFYMSAPKYIRIDEPVDLIDKDYFVNGVIADPMIDTCDGRKGTYEIYSELMSYSKDNIVHINNVHGRILLDNAYKNLDIREGNRENIPFNTKKCDGKYYISYNDLIGRFVIDYDDIDIHNIESLELTFNITVKNGDIEETKELTYLYKPKIYKSSAVDDFMYMY